MLNADQIKKLIEEAVAELKDINEISGKIPDSELLTEVRARRKAIVMLERILAISKDEIQRSSNNKDKLFFLP